MNGKVAYAAVLSLFAAFPIAALAQPQVLPLPRPALPGEPQPAASALALPPPLPAAPPWSDKSLTADARADLVQTYMTREEELVLVRGYFGSIIPGQPSSTLMRSAMRCRLRRLRSGNSRWAFRH